MKLEFITNAGSILTLTSGKQILMDPWLLGNANIGGWYNFPPVSSQGCQKYLSLHPDYIYISHIHSDHLDPATLIHYPKDTKIILGKLPHSHLEQKLNRLGFNNLYLFELNKPTNFENLEIIIFGDFASTSEGFTNEFQYPTDTSLFLKDENGETIFNINDNTIQISNAEEIVKSYGSPTLSIVPYSGASMYPHAFKNYTDAEKLEKRDQLKQRMLKNFISVSQVLGSQYIVPAAGSYVLGGNVAHHSIYLHQATPKQLRDCWESNKMDTTLCFLSEGDILDTATGEINQNEAALFRDFTEDARYNYAMTLADELLPHEKIVIPAVFEIPWQRLLRKARNNLWQIQKQLDLFPQVDIQLHLTNCSTIGGKSNVTESFFFAFDQEIAYDVNKYQRPQERSYISFSIDANLMMIILLNAALWGQAEASAFVLAKRYPDEYNPTIHSLMNLFTL